MSEGYTITTTAIKMACMLGCTAFLTLQTVAYAVEAGMACERSDYAQSRHIMRVARLHLRFIRRLNTL